MGAENSVLDDCEWKSSTSDGLWFVRHGVLKDGMEISIFTCEKRDKKHENLLRKMMKNLSVLRHPGILSYVKGEDAEEGPQLCTEAAKSLSTVLSDLTPVEISAGLYTVLDALSFLHEKASISHNNIHLGSIYVTSDGTWKLGGLEHMTKFSEATATTLNASRSFRHKDALTPEEKSNKVVPEIEYGHARDMFAFGVLAESLLEKLCDLDDLTKTFELRIQDECLNTDPRQRPRAKSLLTDRLFMTEFLEMSLFLKHITLKSSAERSTFFNNLVTKLLNLPEELVAKRLLPGLLSRFVFMDQSAVEHVLPCLLQPCTGDRPTSVAKGETCPIFTEPIFKQYVVPKLIRILTVAEYHIHVLLLQHLPSFVHLVEKEDLEVEVLPQLLLGLRDSSDQIASLSLHSLADLVLILGRDVVIGGQSKKYFKEGMPKEWESVPPMFNNKHSTVQGVLPKMKLIDMARSSERKQQPVDEGEADRKWKEREQRREEMKKRREERKLARAKAKESKVSETDDDTGHDFISSILKLQSPAIEENPVIRDLDNDWTENNQSEDILHPNDSSAVNLALNGQSHLNDESLQADWSEKSVSRKKLENDWSEETFNEEDDNWSDFGNDSHISDEIEKELESMDVQEPVIEKYESVMKKSPEKVLQPTKNPMKLKSKTTTKTNTYNSNNIPDLDMDTSPSTPTSTSLISKTKSPAKSTTSTAKNSANNNLGSEFDIKSIDIKAEKQPDPFDFFADMAPAIKPTVKKTADDVEEKKEKSDNQFSLSMNMMDANLEEVEDGWGNDEDW